MERTASRGNLSRRKKLSKSELRDILWGYVCVAPLTVGLLLFLAVPLVYSLFLSFTTYDLVNAPVFVGFQNFARAFRDAQYWMSVKNAFIAAVGVLVSMALSLLLANIFAKERWGSKALRILFFLPTICSAVAITLMWQSIFDYYSGFLNNMLESMGLDRVMWLDAEHARGSLIFMGVWSGLGINILLYLSSIKNVSSTYYEAAQLDGANGWQQFWHITFPSVSPVTFYILVMGIIGALQDFTKWQVMTNGSPSTTMMPVLLIYKYSGSDYGAFYGYASALSIVLGLIIAALTGLNFLASNKWVYYES